MRVITGSARGRKLKEFPGMDIRPTTDKVKEAIFNIVQFDVEGRRVLDLFGGTGQLGIEALSRGAEHCVFVEQAGEAVKVIRDNLATTGFAEQSRVVRGDALSYLASCREKFSLAFLDPPYHGELLEKALTRMAEQDVMNENGIIVCESPYDAILPALPAPYVMGRDYRYGKIKLTVYHRAASEA